MDTKFIPEEKLSKRARKELNDARRATWGINPVTRKPDNSKAYNRAKEKRRKEDD